MPYPCTASTLWVCHAQRLWYTVMTAGKVSSCYQRLFKPFYEAQKGNKDNGRERHVLCATVTKSLPCQAAVNIAHLQSSQCLQLQLAAYMQVAWQSSASMIIQAHCSIKCHCGGFIALLHACFVQHLIDMYVYANSRVPLPGTLHNSYTKVKAVWFCCVTCWVALIGNHILQCVSRSAFAQSKAFPEDFSCIPKNYKTSLVSRKNTVAFLCISGF